MESDESESESKEPVEGGDVMTRKAEVKKEVVKVAAIAPNWRPAGFYSSRD